LWTILYIEYNIKKYGLTAKAKRAGGTAQVVETLCNQHKAQTPVSPKKKIKRKEEREGEKEGAA
jgi:hypothetical protein